VKAIAVSLIVICVAAILLLGLLFMVTKLDDPSTQTDNVLHEGDREVGCINTVCQVWEYTGDEWQFCASDIPNKITKEVACEE
jgi:hypothetical protein